MFISINIIILVTLKEKKNSLNPIIDMFTRELICIKLHLVIGEFIALIII